MSYGCVCVVVVSKDDNDDDDDDVIGSRQRNFTFIRLAGNVSLSIWMKPNKNRRYNLINLMFVHFGLDHILSEILFN